MKKENKKVTDKEISSGSSLDLLSGTTPRASELKKSSVASINETDIKSLKSSTGKKTAIKATNKSDTDKNIKVKKETESKGSNSSENVKKSTKNKVLKEEKSDEAKQEKVEIAPKRLTKSGSNIASGEELEDLEKINEEGLQNASSRGKRNQLLIIVLSVLLVAAVAFIVVYAVVSRVDKNCYLNIHGGVDAAVVIDGKEKSTLRLRADLDSNTILLLDMDVKIKDAGSYIVKYKINCFHGNEAMKDYDVYEPNREVFKYEDGYFVSSQPVSGQISLCQGVVINNEYGKLFDGYKFSMVVDVYIERA